MTPETYGTDGAQGTIGESSCVLVDRRHDKQ